MQWVRRAAALGFVALLLPACSAPGGPFEGFYNPYPNTVASVSLRGSQVIPALGTGATGTATITVDGLRKFVDYTIDATGLSSAVTAIEIRIGEPGSNGAVLLSVPLGTFPISGRLTDANIAFPPVFSTLSAVGNEIAVGKAYLLISTMNFQTGEIRGHIGTASLASAVLSGSQESTPLSSPGAGTAQVTLNDAQDQIQASVSVAGLASITGALIFDGKPTVDGSAALFSISSAPFTTLASATLTASDFTPSATVTTFADAINALLSGGLYVQILTVAHAGGEIRGQIGATQLNATLTPADVVPPVVSPATGAATIALGARQDQFFFTGTHTVASPLAVEIHVQQPGSNGPRIFNVSAIAGAATSPINVTMTSGTLTTNAAEAINSFQDAINAMLTKRTYVLVTSPSFTAGEVRGQILP
jgi:hypothetical protein